MKPAKIIQTAFVILVTGLLAGCWDSQELNQTSLLTGIALEPGDSGQIRITGEILNVKVAQPLKGDKGASPTIVESIEGNTISEAAYRFNEVLDRKMNVSHANVVIIDEQLARKGIDQYLDVLQRSRYVREDVLIFISKDVRASDVLKILFPRGVTPSWKLQSQLQSYRGAWGGAVPSRLYDLNEAFTAHGRELALAAVTIQGKIAGQDSLENLKAATPKTVVRLDGTAVFHQDKLAGFLSLDESRMLALVVDKSMETIVSVPLEKKGTYAAFRLTKLESEKKVTAIQNKPRIKLVIKGEGIIASTDSEVDLTKVAAYEDMEQRAAAYIKTRMDQTIRHVQNDWGVDVFGFGETLYRWHYRQFKGIEPEWNELFAQTPVEVEVSIALRRSELKTKPIKRS